MTLAEVNQLMEQVDCRDAGAVEAALIERARALAEHASSASRELLKQTLVTGNEFRERLEMAQIESRRELDRMTKLRRGLASTLAEHQSDQITCFG
jgi:hypothetical protein